MALAGTEPMLASTLEQVLAQRREPMLLFRLDYSPNLRNELRSLQLASATLVSPQAPTAYLTVNEADRKHAGRRMLRRIVFHIFLNFMPAISFAACLPSPPPTSWSSSSTSTIPSERIDGYTTPSLTIVLFRHAERPLLASGNMDENGNLGEQGIKRLSQLPERLFAMFGCPDLLVTAQPAVKVKDKQTGQYFNYVRPLMTLSTISAKLDYPVWIPYGYNQSDFLVHDFLNDEAFKPKPDGRPKKVFVAWEHENIERMYGHLLEMGTFESLAGGDMTVDGKKLKCETAPAWDHCDFDSVWLINIQNMSMCLTVLKEGLNSPSYQHKCKPSLK